MNRPGQNIRPEDRTRCKYCGQGDLAWYRTKAGRWMLCNTAPSQNHDKATKDVRHIAPWSPHRCGGDRRQSATEAMEAEYDRRDRIAELERRRGVSS